MYYRKKKKLLKVSNGDLIRVKLENDAFGSEQCGDRLAVVIQNDIGNEKSSTTIVAFCTAKNNKKRISTHVNLNVTNDLEYFEPDFVAYEKLKNDSIILCEQIRTIDRLRIINKIGKLNDNAMLKVEQALRISLNINKSN